ncbi:MotA/TolQ/ExbB proton channel family protein [Neorhodopirellula pilleata]|uniref:Colicin uptake protein TolQ n=1 Tax=Neorhodopirellula pilleata TaxID=2714738 RepID=A0A5C6ARH4_9BACT|nr:MotA/TolQ/ExbB proton channel family protein [Neorhodopirellula pilleata]TWU01666.1 colicin uptake protein TolQ [Neorhodopirellula pilleata]
MNPKSILKTRQDRRSPRDRFAPIAIALLLLGGFAETVSAQNYNFNPNGGFNGNFNQGNGNYPANNYGASQPAARVAAAPATATQQLGTANQFSIPAAPEETPAAEPESSSWQMPAFISKITEGGWLMVPLAICSLIVLGLSIERMIALRRSRVIPKPFVRRFTECVEDGQLSYEEATSICDEFDCPVAEVFHSAVRRWGRPMLEIEQAVIDAGDRVGDSLRRFLRVFHAISNVTPLIGLLGTVLGMIQAFENLSESAGGGQNDLLAAGISQALITTAGGLSVAIPAYLAYMYFSAKSDRYLGEIDKLCQRVIDCISAEGLENNGAAKAPRKRRAA